MGGLSIALDDTLADAPVNPAPTGRLNGMNVVTHQIGVTLTLNKRWVLQGCTIYP
jgi:hypothetical protein